jgi:hypothetical protein
MSTENTILLTATSTESQQFLYSEKQKGAGYYRRDNPVHTAVFQFNNFKGSVKIQATLTMYPSDGDWFDVEYDNGDALEAVDSTPLLTNVSRNFTGNFIWLRAAYQLEQGEITEIRFSV